MKGLGATLTYTELGDIQSAVTVQTTDSATINGANLITAYAKAKTLTPNGAALSVNNRACVIVPPGKYNLDCGGDAPAPAGITITPDAVGDNPVTWYYRCGYVTNSNSPRSLITEESSFTIGDSTTSIVVAGGTIPEWADVMSIILGTVSGIYEYSAFPSVSSFPTDIYGGYVNGGLGNLYPLVLAVPVYQGYVPLILDTEFVDIIGLTTDRSLQHIYGTPEATNSGVIMQTADDVHISNLTVEILTAFGEPSEDSTDSAAYFPSTNLNNAVVDNCYFIGYQTGVNTTILYSMRLGVEYSGTFTNNKCGDSAFGYQGSASGTFTNCIGGSASFGTAGIASGTFTNCTGGDNSFGYFGTASGTFINCTGGERSFGANGILSGLINFCNISGSEFTVPFASVATITLVAGGTGYTANDELTVVGGTGTAATIKVLTVNAGVIVTAEILTVGAYSVEPANSVAVTGGTGNNDATFDLTWHEGHVYGCIDSTGFIAETNWNDGA